MKKFFKWLKMWLLAIGGCFSSKLETLYLMGDKQLMDRIKNPAPASELLSFDDLDW